MFVNDQHPNRLFLARFNLYNYVIDVADPFGNKCQLQDSVHDSARSL